MKNFAATDFKIVMEEEDIQGIYKHIRAKDSDNHAQITNLIEDGYLVFNKKHADGKVFLKHTNADFVVHCGDIGDIETNDFSLGYDNDADSGGQEASEKIASVNILEAFATAMNIVMPIAQQRAIDGMEKRYGVKAPTNG